MQAITEAVARACLGAGVPLAIALPALAQPPGAATPPASRREAVEEIVVEDSADGLYRIEDSSLTKLTEPLRDVPQSIVTLPRQLLDDRGVTTLNEALRMVPGITLGAGEFSWQGNNPNIRGFNSRNDMFLDGMRDFGSYPRDPFNLETVEVLQGPSSMIFGRGSTGGAINQVTKRPFLEPLTSVSFNGGNDDTLRGAADISRPLPALGPGAAVRINAMAHEGEVAGRDGAESSRYGVAPSLALGLDGPTRLTLSYLHQSTDDRPDYGLPWLGSVAGTRAAGKFLRVRERLPRDRREHSVGRRQPHHERSLVLARANTRRALHAQESFERAVDRGRLGESAARANPGEPQRFHGAE